MARALGREAAWLRVVCGPFSVVSLGSVHKRAQVSYLHMWVGVRGLGFRGCGKSSGGQKSYVQGPTNSQTWPIP